MAFSEPFVSTIFIKMNSIKKIFSYLLIITLLYSCKFMKRDPYTDTPTTGRIKIVVDESFKPIIDAELMVFEGLYSYAEITPLYLPEKEAMQLLLNDSIHLVIAARGLTEYEKEYFKQHSLYPTEVEIAKDAIALIINKENNDTLMTMDQLKKIITGKITRWRQINPSTKLGNIQVVFDNKNSSTVRFAVDSICKNEKISEYLNALDLNTDVIDYIGKHPNSLGLIGVSWISDREDSTMLSFLKKVNVISLSMEKEATLENSFKPYQAYIYKGWYPLTRMIYAISTDPQGGLPSGFLSFLASDKGQRIILKSGILPAIVPTRVVHVREY